MLIAYLHVQCTYVSTEHKNDIYKQCPFHHSYMMGESLTQSVLSTTNTALMKMPVDSTQCIMKWCVSAEYTENEIVQPANHPTNQHFLHRQFTPALRQTILQNLDLPFFFAHSCMIYISYHRINSMKNL